MSKDKAIKLLEVKIQGEFDGATALEISCNRCLKGESELTKQITRIFKAINDDRIELDPRLNIFSVSFEGSSPSPLDIDLSFATQQRTNILEIYKDMFDELGLIVSSLLLHDYVDFMNNDMKAEMSKGNSSKYKN